MELVSIHEIPIFFSNNVVNCRFLQLEQNQD